MSIYEDFNTDLSEEEMVSLAIAMSENEYKIIEREKLATRLVAERALKLEQEQEYRESLRRDMEKDIIQELDGEDDYEYECMEEPTQAPSETPSEEPQEGDIVNLRLARLRFFEKKN